MSTVPMFAIALFAQTLSQPAAGAQERRELQAERTVEPGDSLWRIAQDTGCSVDELQKANGLADEPVLRIGKRLHIPRCTGSGATLASRAHVVEAGDTLSRIARRYGVTLEQITALNDLNSTVIVVGQRLRVPDPVPRIRLVAGESVGRPHRGTLQGGARLRPGRGYHLRRPDRTFAASHVVDHTAAALSTVRREHPKLHRIAVGDLSSREGGWLSGHRSHQSGRDVDVGLCFKRPPRVYPREFAAGSKETLDLPATWTLIRAFARTEDKSGGAERIFLDYKLQGLVYEHARRWGASRRELDQVFQYPHGRRARRGVVRHLRAHGDHLHVRFRCPDDDASCR